MKKIGVILITITFIFIIGCEKESVEVTDNKVIGTYVEENKRQYIQDEEIGKFIFKIRKIENLNEYKVYRNENEMNIDFYFSEDTNRSDIMSSKDVVTEVFVWKRGFQIAGPYPHILYSQDDWDKVNHRVFIGKRKILEQNIYKNKVTIDKIDYYEDTEIELPSRIVENDDMKELSKKIKRKYWWDAKDVVFEKSFKGNVLFVKIKCRDKLDDKEIAVVKDFISTGFAEKLAKSSADKYKMNMDYRGIVLMLYHKDKKYYEKTYHNTDNEKYWFSEYWGNHKFFDFNN